MIKTRKAFLLLLAGLVLSSCGWMMTGVSITGVTLSDGTLTPAFDPAVTDYTATVANATASVDVEVTSDNSDLSVTINETTVLPGSGTASIPLAVGANTVTIVMSDGAETVTYTVVVTRLTAPAPEISVVGKANYFDEVAVELVSGSTVDFDTDSSTRAILFTIKNTGTAPLTLTGASPNYVSIVNADTPGYYSVSVQPTPTSDSIGPGEQETFEIEFGGVDLWVTKTGTVTITSDDDDEDTFTLSLTGIMSC